MARSSVAAAAVALLALILSPLAASEGVVTGHARYPKIVDKPALGYVEQYEWNLFLCPLGGGSIGPSRRLGAPPGEPARHDGYFSISAEAGLYSLYVSQPLFYARPTLIRAVEIRSGRTTTLSPAPAIDICTNVTDTWALPYQTTWYQTFAGRGTSITGVSFRLAGTNASEIEIAVLAVEDGAAPGAWSEVSPGTARRVPAGALGDTWGRWRSGDIPTVPGSLYAVRLRGVAGGDRGFSPFNRAKDANSPPDARAYNGAGQAQAYDVNVTVFSDSDGVVIPYAKTTTGLGDLRDGYFGGRWAQTFRATGSSLAAVDVWAAGGNNHWDLDFTFTIRKGGPSGLRIGSVKTTKAAYQAFGAGLHAVCYNPGEVSLIPGQTYAIEFTNPEGFNPYVFDRGQDAYAGGAAYQDGALKDGGSVDLSMTIVEYEPGGGAIAGVVRDGDGRAIGDVSLLVDGTAYGTISSPDGTFRIAGIPPGTYTLHAFAPGFDDGEVTGIAVAAGATRDVAITLDAAACTEAFRNGGFEDDLAGWTPYGGARTDTATAPYFADIEPVDGARFHGNPVNWTLIPSGGLLQRFCVEPGHRIRATVWSNIYWIGGNSGAASSRVGLDPAGGDSAVAPSIVWSAWHRQPSEGTAGWKKLAVEADAAGGRMTLFLDFRQVDASPQPAGGQWRINCFDAAAVEDLSPQTPRFRRGDANDDGTFDLADAIAVLEVIFADRPTTCFDALDIQDDGSLTIADAIVLLSYLFSEGAAPAPPFPSCGEDPTPDPLDCEATSC
ncbi:MAG: carboxypeptidase regulatory-like domain-containing protein [Planctomycetes bacterium]|nr:carboxypeptidase regulatory-like domain-containing protein [Planctomycetota bacterium]